MGFGIWDLEDQEPVILAQVGSQILLCILGRWIKSKNWVSGFALRAPPGMTKLFRLFGFPPFVLFHHLVHVENRQQDCEHDE